MIRDVFPVAETGFDPAAVHDLYSGTVVQALHETLFTYDYLAQPAKIVPLTAEAMPEIQDGGRTWIVKLKKGILFTPDAVFKGKPRELVAEDYLYSLKRLADPKIRSPWTFLVEGKFQGLDELTAEAKKTGRFDYDRKIPGLEVARSLHDALPAQVRRLQPSVRACARADVRCRARGDRGVRGRRRARECEPGRHRARTVSSSGCEAARSC